MKNENKQNKNPKDTNTVNLVESLLNNLILSILPSKAANTKDKLPKIT